VLTEYPLRAIVENPETVTEIRPLGVTFESRTSIKGQVLADFTAEFTPRTSPQSNLLKRLDPELGRSINWQGVRVG